MTDPREVLAQTEKRLAEVEALQLTLKETQLELNAYAEMLRHKLAELQPPAPVARDAGTRAAAAPPAKSNVSRISVSWLVFMEHLQKEVLVRAARLPRRRRRNDGRVVAAGRDPGRGRHRR